jgi:hypothetical protein
MSKIKEKEFLEMIDKKYIQENKYKNDLCKLYYRYFTKFKDDTLYGHFTLKQMENGTLDNSVIIQYFKRFRKIVHKWLYGKKNSWKDGKSISYVIGIENGGSGKHLHGHVIFAGHGLSRICRMCVKNVFEEVGKYAGMVRVWRYDFRLGAKRGFFYLAKHQIKRNNIIDFLDKGGDNRTGVPGTVVPLPASVLVLEEKFKKEGIELEEPLLCYKVCRKWEKSKRKKE